MASEAVEQQKSGPSGLVLRSAIVAALGGLIFGFDTAVISGTTKSLEQVFGLDSFGLGFAVSSATIGTIIGAIFAGSLADRFGRKKMLFAMGGLFLVGALGTALSPASAYWLFITCRILGGIGVGFSSVCAPIYTAEISPAAHRGRLVGLVQFNIVLGILVAYASNAIIRAVVDGPDAWRWMLGVMAIPALIFISLLFSVPETPRWLMSQGREAEAREVSQRLCRTEEESENQIAEIRAQLQADAKASAKRVPFFTKRYRKVILMAFCIAMFNQLSGINAILYYAPMVMQEAGAGESASYLMSIAVGFMNLIATMLALTVIDKLGRRTAHAGGLDWLPGEPRVPHLRHVQVRRQLHFHLLLDGARWPPRLHRRPRFWPGLGYLGLHLGNLPQPGARARSVLRFDDPLGFRRSYVLRFPVDAFDVRRWGKLPLLLPVHVRPAILGFEDHARNEGDSARGNGLHPGARGKVDTDRSRRN